jgi:ion channel-forming bestrophin family protein
MHAGRHYSLREVLTWTRRELLTFTVMATVPPGLFCLGVDVGVIPWAPVVVLGTAVAFVTGFKCNAAYGRLWEARQVWGAIVNASRSWGVMVRDLIEPGDDPRTHERMVLRHVAWLTALRYQLREPRVWETKQQKHNLEFEASHFIVPERKTTLEEELGKLLSADECARVLAKKNRAAALLALQSEELKQHNEAGRLSEYRQVELVRTVSSLYDQQGKCERIKNFPYPRQFATLNLIFVWLFITLLPFGLTTEFKRLGTTGIWLTVPLTMVIAWVFHTMDKIGEASENPFEGSANDVPISAMSRGIEIDLRDMLGQEDLPPPLAPMNNILM